MDIERIIAQFATEGRLHSIKANKEGHINNTFISTFKEGDITHKYTHQRLNRTVFFDPVAVMQNIEKVTAHLQAKVAHLEDASRRSLDLVPTKEGAKWAFDAEGELWRTYHYIDGVKTYPFLDDRDLAFRFGVAVGTFQAQLADFDGSSLSDSIPNFHHMGFRYQQFHAALAADRAHRLASAREEVDFFLAQQKRAMTLTEALEDKKVPIRVTHNDTKINNVLFDEHTGEGLCMIDLDTVMGGTLLFDTGDMIRTGCSTAAEDEPDLSKVDFDADLFSSLIGGYRSIADSFLTETERSLIVESGRAITLIMGLRMFTDYLEGDRYYHVDHPKHNLVRSRTQIKLIESMDRQWEHLIACCH